MGNVVGIDLGTTNSVAAFKFAEVEVVTHKDNAPPERKLTRSVVAFDQGKLLVGETGYNQMRNDPENVIISIKRLMGRGFNDPVIQEQLSRFGYKISKPTQGTENSISVWLGGKEYQPEDISAEIIKQVAENAQIYQQERGQTSTINQVVVTIPAYFNDKQRHSTETAATKAGLNLMELLPEPTAAAISFGFKPDDEEVRTILVYDFGGGTFDSSLITAYGNRFIESGKAGDLWLGGDDIDYKIIEYVKQEIAENEQVDNIDILIAKMPFYQRVRFNADLKMAAEKAKIELSDHEVAHIITSTPLIDEFGAIIDVDVTITRSQFEEMILPLVERSITICKDAIKYSDYPEDMVDIVLLVGGSAQIPIVQKKVLAAFGEDKVKIHPRPMYAVAEGAAIVAAGLTEKVTTVSRDYYIKLVDTPFKIISRNDILPVTTSHTFKTEADGQRLIHFKFFSPDHVSANLDKIKRDEVIGDMWLALDQFYPKGTEVLVNVELDEKNNSLQITATLKNDPNIKVSKSFSRGGIDEEISRSVEQLIEEMNEEGNLTHKGVEEANRIAGEVIQTANQIYINGQILPDKMQNAERKLRELEAFASEDYDRAKFFISDFDFLADSCYFMLNEKQRNRLLEVSQQLKTSVNNHNLSGIQKYSEDAKKEVDNLPHEVRLILIAKEAISRAYTTNASHAKVMSGKFSQMLYALERREGNEADRIWQDLLPDVQQYLNQELPTGSIVIGLTK
jgi:molecular chaperone DnaK